MTVVTDELLRQRFERMSTEDLRRVLQAPDGEYTAEALAAARDAFALRPAEMIQPAQASPAATEGDSVVSQRAADSARSHGDAALPIPWLVWVHLGIVALLTVYLGHSHLMRAPRRYQWEPSESQQRLESVGFWVQTVVLIPLYFALLKRRRWAQIVIGIITLPLGLVLLVPRSVRQFTGAPRAGPAEGSMLGLDGR